MSRGSSVVSYVPSIIKTADDIADTKIWIAASINIKATQ